MRSLPEQHAYWSPLSLHRVEVPEPDHYRLLFRLVGAPWLWFSRLTLDDAHLAAIIQHPKVELYSIRDENDREVGIVELDLREPYECELAFIGLIPELSGKGTRTLAARGGGQARLARGRRPSPRPHLLARSPCRALRPIAVPASPHTSARSSAFLDPRLLGFCRWIAPLRSRCSVPTAEPRPTRWA